MRSFLELRRLARQAQRDDEARAILHDALLETIPAYGEAIVQADRLSENRRNAINVWFFPTLLNRTTRLHGTTRLAFEVHHAFVDREHLRPSQRRAFGEVDRALVVYETIPTRYLRYVDIRDDGGGDVIDLRDGRVMGHRRPARGRGLRWDSPRQSVAALNTAFLRWMRERLAHHYTREQLIFWLRWADPNGDYTDEHANREGQPPLTHQEAADLVFDHVYETKETLEEMRGSARR